MSTSTHPPLHRHDEPEGLLVLQDGLIAGVLGGITVALVFLIRDLWIGEPLHTPTALATLLFRGPEAAAEATSDVQLALAWNGIHMLSWAIAGVVAAWLVTAIERVPQFWYLAFVAVAFLFAAFLWIEGAFGVPGLGRFQLWTGAVLGSAVMVAYLAWRHPGLREVAEHIYDGERPLREEEERSGTPPRA